MTVAPGVVLSHYRITAALGAGGMGEVWRATDERLGREVALKVLPEAVAQVPERLARFEREARVLASLNHPNIAHLYGLESSVILTEQGFAGSGSRPVILSEPRPEGSRRVEGSPEARSQSWPLHSPEESGDPSTRGAAAPLAQDDRGGGWRGHASRVPDGAGGNSKLKTQN